VIDDSYTGGHGLVTAGVRLGRLDASAIGGWGDRGKWWLECNEQGALLCVVCSGGVPAPTRRAVRAFAHEESSDCMADLDAIRVFVLDSFLTVAGLSCAPGRPGCPCERWLRAESLHVCG
jgi:hypothetical protein